MRKYIFIAFILAGYYVSAQYDYYFSTGMYVGTGLTSLYYKSNSSYAENPGRNFHLGLSVKYYINDASYILNEEELIFNGFKIIDTLGPAPKEIEMGKIFFNMNYFYGYKFSRLLSADAGFFINYSVDYKYFFKLGPAAGVNFGTDRIKLRLSYKRTFLNMFSITKEDRGWGMLNLSIIYYFRA